MGFRDRSEDLIRELSEPLDKDIVTLPVAQGLPYGLKVAPLFYSEERMLQGGDTFSVDFKIPEGAIPFNARWVLVRVL